MPAIVCSVVPRITGLPDESEKLESLALADRVVTEHGHAVLRQQNAHSLICFGGLAVVAMAAGNEHAGKGPLPFG